MQFFKIISSPIIVFIIFLSSCAIHKKIRINNIFLKSTDLTIPQVRAFELNNNSKEIPGQTFTISKDLYPNPQNFELQFPIVFYNQEKPSFKTETDYFFSKEGSVKAILYQWNNINLDGIIVGENFKASILKADTDKIYKRFQIKFDSLEKALIKEFKVSGELDNSSNVPNGFRRGLKWHTNKLNAHLVLFGNNSQSFRQIRLIVYKN